MGWGGGYWKRHTAHCSLSLYLLPLLPLTLHDSPPSPPSSASLQGEESASLRAALAEARSSAGEWEREARDAAARLAQARCRGMQMGRHWGRIHDECYMSY